MIYQTYSHRNAENLFNTDVDYMVFWNDVKLVIESITDEDIISRYTQRVRAALEEGKTLPVSISDDVNKLISERMPEERWEQQVPIFNGEDIFGNPYKTENQNDTRWTLDFATKSVERNHEAVGIALEVAFNHGEAIAWNLIKPVLASELNHVEKAVQTSAGMVICATDDMKLHGDFDSACGSYEKFLRYIVPMNQILSSPVLIVGIDVTFQNHVETYIDEEFKEHEKRVIIRSDGSETVLYDVLTAKNSNIDIQRRIDKAKAQRIKELNRIVKKQLLAWNKAKKVIDKYNELILIENPTAAQKRKISELEPKNVIAKKELTTIQNYVEISINELEELGESTNEYIIEW